MDVMKFGVVSVGDAARLRELARIVGAVCLDRRGIPGAHRRLGDPPHRL
jgi:hypothetical protein